MAKYWKNSSGVYIKIDGAYPKCDACPCVAECPTDCTACAGTYSLTFESYGGFCCCDQAALLVSEGPFTLTRVADEDETEGEECQWASGTINLSATLQAQISLFCDGTNGWTIAMTFLALIDGEWVDPMCDDSGVRGFAACPDGAYTFAVGGSGVLSAE